MKIVCRDIQIGSSHLLLCNQRVVFWPELSALILADLHVGKAAHFRKNGIAIPSSVLMQDLQRLEYLIDFFSASRLIINGDLIHAGDNSEVDLFCAWREKRADLRFDLVKGNHDRLTVDLTDKLCLDSTQTRLPYHDFTIVHEFDPEIDAFQVTGHVHPGVRIPTKTSAIRLPCFALSDKQLLLPAYSHFTGLDIHHSPKNGRCFAFTDEAIYEL